MRRSGATTPRKAAVTGTLGVTTAILSLVVAIAHFYDGEPAFGAIWSVLAVWWCVFAVFLTRPR